MSYSVPKLTLSKESSDTISPIAGGSREFIPFPKDISPKMNLIVQLELELTPKLKISTLAMTLWRFPHFSFNLVNSSKIFQCLKLVGTTDQIWRVVLNETSNSLFWPMKNSPECECFQGHSFQIISKEVFQRFFDQWKTQWSEGVKC